MQLLSFQSKWKLLKLLKPIPASCQWCSSAFLVTWWADGATIDTGNACSHTIVIVNNIITFIIINNSIITIIIRLLNAVTIGTGFSYCYNPPCLWFISMEILKMHLLAGSITLSDTCLMGRCLQPILSPHSTRLDKKQKTKQKTQLGQKNKKKSTGPKNKKNTGMGRN